MGILGKVEAGSLDREIYKDSSNNVFSCLSSNLFFFSSTLSLPLSHSGVHGRKSRAMYGKVWAEGGEKDSVLSGSLLSCSLVPSLKTRLRKETLFLQDLRTKSQRCLLSPPLPITESLDALFKRQLGCGKGIPTSPRCQCEGLWRRPEPKGGCLPRTHPQRCLLASCIRK